MTSADANIKQLLIKFKKYLAELEDVNKNEMPTYKKHCKSMIELAGEIDAILRNE